MLYGLTKHSDTDHQNDRHKDRANNLARKRFGQLSADDGRCGKDHDWNANSDKKRDNFHHLPTVLALDIRPRPVDRPNTSSWSTCVRPFILMVASDTSQIFAAGRSKSVADGNAVASTQTVHKVTHRPCGI